MSTPGKFSALLVLALVSFAAAQGQQAQPSADTQLTAQLQRLDPKNGKEARLDALNWISRNTGEKEAARVSPALEKCIHDDPEWKVRQRAVGALGQLALRLKKPCPVVIFEALHDKEDFVRYEAVVWAGLFKKFAPGSADVLLRGVKADNAELRGSSLLLLGHVAPRDPKALAAMEGAKQDKVLDVRHSAHMALFTARNTLDEHLPYLIRVREDPASFLSPGPEDSEAGKEERKYRNLVQLGIAAQMIDWSETRTDELARVLMKLLKDESPILRRGAARLIGASAQKQELPRKQLDPFAPPEKDAMSWLLPYLEPEPGASPKKESKPPQPPRPSRVAEQLGKLKVEAALRKLRDDDPDRTVRDAAGWALERLATVRARKP